jgi:outer membrane murein-binding lipoprotein Lpp
MKRLFVFVGIVFVALGIFSGCSDNIKQQNVALKAENEGLKNEVQLLQSQITDLRKTIQASENRQQDLEASHQKTIQLLEDNQRQMENSYKSDLQKLQAELAQVKSEAEALKTNSEAKVEQKGRFRINVTYKYNDFVGNRADVGASVVLQSINSNTNVYSGKVGGDGYAVINQIIPGKYLCLIISANTQSGGSISQDDADNVRKYLTYPPPIGDKMANIYLLNATMYKIKTMFVNVSAGEETQTSYDFWLSAN